jgi:hypothetical protein
MQIKRSISLNLIASLLFIGLATSCKKLVEVKSPVNSVTDASVYENDLTAIASLTGLYARISSQEATSFGQTISMFAGISADELSIWTGANATLQAYYTNELAANLSFSAGQEVWNTFYPIIFHANAAIEGLSASNQLSPAVKQQLLGEAKFIRGFLYFYLVNLYGDVPLVISTDFEKNRLLPRAPKALVYESIISELKEAQALLSPKYLSGGLQPYPSVQERVRPAKWAASALLARVYLYNGNFANAEAEATAVINENSLFSLSSLENVFLKNSAEAIWQLQPVVYGYNTDAGRLFNLSATPAGFSNDKPVYLSPVLYSAFETNDNRKLKWISTYTSGASVYNFPYKYKIGEQNSAVSSPGALTEYLMMLRLGEQYLIRAEARAEQENLSGAKNDLDVIRMRAGLSGTTAIDITTLRTAILHERQVELFTEWGHRWLDLKRTGNANAVMSTIAGVKGGVWQPTDQLYPIPLPEIQRDPNLIQNDGY